MGWANYFAKKIVWCFGKENRPSQNKTSTPTIHFQVLCNFFGGVKFSKKAVYPGNSSAGMPTNGMFPLIRFQPKL